MGPERFESRVVSLRPAEFDNFFTDLAQLAPVVTPGIADRYSADTIFGFPAVLALLTVSVGETDTFGPRANQTAQMRIRACSNRLAILS